MLTTAASIATAAGVIIAYGFCLGIGFYISRKATNQVDWFFLSETEKASLRGIA